MDAKALYDALLSEQQNQDDERAALECSLIKEDMVTLGCRPRWVPHDKNPSDGMTKDQGGHMAPLYRMMKDHVWRITSEEEELKERALFREQMGYKS